MIVAFYSFHQTLVIGELHFTTDISTCQGLHAFCGQVTQKLKEVSISRKTSEYFSIYVQLELTRYYTDILLYSSFDLEIPVLERTAFIGIATKGTHTYNVIAVRPNSCAVIQYFSRKVYPTGRARECTISMIRARDTGSGELNIRVNRLSEYSNQCAQLRYGIWVHTQWTLLLGPDPTKSYILSKVVPQCSQISAHVEQTQMSFRDLLQTPNSKVTKQYIEETFFGWHPKLHKYSHSLNQSVLANSLRHSGRQFGIGHVYSIIGADYSHSPTNDQHLETVIDFWAQPCSVRLSITLTYQLSRVRTSTKLYHLQFTIQLQPHTKLSLSQPQFYFRRYILLKMNKITSDASVTCKMGFDIDIKRRFGEITAYEENMWMKFGKKESIPGKISEFANVYVAWGYESLSWKEANTKCSAMGGHLPSVTTKEELDFLEKAVWGKFTSAQLQTHPCRLSSVVCSFFMGLDTRLVSENFSVLHIS